MNRSFWFSSMACLALTSCGATVAGEAPPLASAKVSTHSSAAIEKAVLWAFREKGFRVSSRGPQTIGFVKSGGRGAEWAWSTIDNPNPVTIHPTVSWQRTGDGEFRVVCQVDIAQQSTAFGETTRQPQILGKLTYYRLLQEVKQDVERNW